MIIAGLLSVAAFSLAFTLGSPPPTLGPYSRGAHVHRSWAGYYDNLDEFFMMRGWRIPNVNAFCGSGVLCSIGRRNALTVTRTA